MKLAILPVSKNIVEINLTFEINKYFKTRNLNYLILKLDMLESLLSQECMHFINSDLDQLTH